MGVVPNLIREPTVSTPAPTTETLSGFARHAAEWLERLKATGQPVVLTSDGKAELVVQDVAAYRRLVQQAERAEMMEFLRKSHADMEAGRTRPAREAIEALGRSDAVPG
jgi:PHD/YefM family antitoxin component YafN of YafNO toxin-antitoxin module